MDHATTVGPPVGTSNRQLPPRSPQVEAQEFEVGEPPPCLPRPRLLHRPVQPPRRHPHLHQPHDATSATTPTPTDPGPATPTDPGPATPTHPPPTTNPETTPATTPPPSAATPPPTLTPAQAAATALAHNRAANAANAAGAATANAKESTLKPWTWTHHEILHRGSTILGAVAGASDVVALGCAGIPGVDAVCDSTALGLSGFSGSASAMLDITDMATHGKRWNTTDLIIDAAAPLTLGIGKGLQSSTRFAEAFERTDRTSAGVAGALGSGFDWAGFMSNALDWNG